MAKYIYRLTFTETKEVEVEIPDDIIAYHDIIRDAAMEESENNWESLKYTIENEEFINENNPLAPPTLGALGVFTRRSATAERFTVSEE